MDIHPPSGPVHSFKDFFIHLSMIVFGILLALSLEQIVEWRHHKELAHEAEANITSEIRDNKAELDKTLESYPDTEANLQKALAIAKEIRAHRKIHELSLTLSLRISQLSTASRSSAQATGALAFIEYQDVKRLVGVYDIQQQYLRLQDRALDTIPLTLAALKEDPAKLNEREAEALSSTVQTGLANLYLLRDIGRSLSREYGSALSGKR